ncbi:hypothetical protein WA1_19080 [Scytonema hofmannii PCC 7110]|uniref:Uncharacterized protein n=1 Tax=Scytonema hofmannii PCC 7110 TaxID=128403 RepID=A0A139XBP3_9CYAN|nr:hypothetical protein [Scytonema hofmannii]KYC42105.1 hypothetical protein WA1_19080 [Scytonema hofmannii PCC 7110]
MKTFQMDFQKFINSLTLEQEFFLGGYLNDCLNPEYCPNLPSLKAFRDKLLDKLRSRSDEENKAIAAKVQEKFFTRVY